MLGQMLKNEHLAVLTTAGPISMKHVGDHLNGNWGSYTKGLKENEQLRILILCGVHGGHDGKVGGDARNVEDFTNLAVSFDSVRHWCYNLPHAFAFLFSAYF